MYASEFGATNKMMRKFSKMEINADIQLTLSASLSEKSHMNKEIMIVSKDY